MLHRSVNISSQMIRGGFMAIGLILVLRLFQNELGEHE